MISFSAIVRRPLLNNSSSFLFRLRLDHACSSAYSVVKGKKGREKGDILLFARLPPLRLNYHKDIYCPYNTSGKSCFLVPALRRDKSRLFSFQISNFK